MSTINEDLDKMEMQPDEDNDYEENPQQKFIDILKEFLSNDNIEKKSRINSEQFTFLIQSYTLNDYLEEKYSIWHLDKNKKKVYDFRMRNRVLDYLCWHIIEKVISLDGKGRSEIIDFFKPIAEQLTNETKVSKIEFQRSHV
jgi:arginine utilization protein RocB